MAFYRPDEEELKCSSRDALRRHIADCHKEIDFLSDVRESQAAMIGKFNQGEPIKVTENGIDTWFNLPVKTPAGLVPADRTACEVRSCSLPFPRDWIGTSGAVREPELDTASAVGSLRILLADKPAPQFEVGKCYKNRRGHIVGPLLSNGGGGYPFTCGHRTYTERGTVFLLLGETDDDLIQPAVDPPPTWVPWPWLPDGEYMAGPTIIRGTAVDMYRAAAKRLRGYTSDPKQGRWQVTNGTAAWLGE
jgi:hypothetical protein